MSETVNWEKAYRDQTERVAELRRENAALRSLLRESLDCIDQYDYEEAFDMVQRIKAALGGHK